MMISSPRRKSNRGFTLFQLLVVIAVIVILFAFALPVIHRMQQGSHRSGCATNLKQIGLAMIMYMNAERDGGFPRTYFDESNPRKKLDLTDAGFVNGGTMAVDSFSSTNNPLGANLPGNSIGGSFFLLLKTQDLTPDVFICTSSNGTHGFDKFPVQNSNNFAGWGPASAIHAGNAVIPDCTYSYCNPFFARDMKAGLYKNQTPVSDFAVAADVNPGTQTINGFTGSPATVNPGDAPEAKPDGTGQAFGNSTNHKNQGQYVLYLDGHVEFQTTCWCGQYRTTAGGDGFRDNIYTNGTQSSAGGSFGTDAFPQDAGDSVLLPTAN
jgi:type II secretory pathway pseudopilin PulG